MSKCEKNMGVGSLVSPQPREFNRGCQGEHSSASSLHKSLGKWSETGLMKPLDTSEHLSWGQRRAVTLFLLESRGHPVISAFYCSRGFDRAGEVTPVA